MAMQSTLWSINALSTELGIDRRTLAKRLQHLPPAEVKQVGRRIEKRWRLADVIAHLQPYSKEGTVNPPNGLRIFSEETVRHFAWWLTEEWGPAWSGLLKSETDLSKEQIHHLYKQQFGLLVYYLDEYLVGDELNKLHQEQTGYSLDDLASMAAREAVKSEPPEPGAVALPMPSAIKALMTEDELAKLATAV
jgi:hypothetical protein